MAVAIAQRTKIVGAAFAKNPKSGYALGRLSLANVVSDGEHDAGLEYLSVVTDFSRLHGLPSPNCSSQMRSVLGNNGGHVGNPSDAVARRITNRYLDAYASLSGETMQLRAVNKLVIEDMDASLWTTKMVEDAKAGLLKLSAHFGKGA